MKTITFFIISSMLGVIMLFTACSKEDSINEMPLEKVPVSNFVLKTTTSFDTTTTLATALLASGSGKYQQVTVSGLDRIQCVPGGDNCFPSVTVPAIGNSLSTSWMQLMAIFNNSGPEIGTFFYEFPHLLNIDSVDRVMVINLFKDNLVRIVPAYSNTNTPASNQIQHFCIIEKTAALEKDYSNVIYVLQYRYIP